MSRTRTLSDDTVLERATAVFWRNGYAGTSVRDLTQATGLSTAALYNRFADKNRLFVEALRRYADNGLTEPIERLSATGAPLDAIRALADHAIVSLPKPQLTDRESPAG